MISVGVIGYGYWGPNLVRNLMAVPNCSVVAVADVSESRLACALEQFPSIWATTSIGSVLDSDNVDAVAVATPVSTHYSIAKRALESRKHVLVEKPLTAQALEAKELVYLARENGRVLMVDHTFLYSGSVRILKKLIDDGCLGEVCYYGSVRANLGLFQRDVDVIWDLAPHDYSILLYLFDEAPTSVAAVGLGALRALGYNHSSIGHVTLRFGNSRLAHLQLSWLSPVKTRYTVITGSKRMVVYDHLNHESPIQVFDRGVELVTGNDGGASIRYREGDVWIPAVDRTEPLYSMCCHFVSCVASGATPLSDGNQGLQVVKLLEMTEQSMTEGGRPIPL